MTYSKTSIDEVREMKKNLNAKQRSQENDRYNICHSEISDINLNFNLDLDLDLDLDLNFDDLKFTDDWIEFENKLKNWDIKIKFWEPEK